MADAVGQSGTNEDNIESLVHDLRNGNVNAFEAIVRSLARPLVAYAARSVESSAIAEDIVQDVFASLWFRRETIALNSSLKAYLYKAVHHRIGNYFRSRDRLNRFSERMTESRQGSDSRRMFSSNTEHELDVAELNKAYSKALLAFPPRTREVFVLIREQSLTYREAAEILGISPKTVESHMGNALAGLRRALKDWVS